MALSREAEELLFAAGLAEQDAAYGGGPSTYDLLRAATRRSMPSSQPAPRRRPVPLPSPRRVPVPRSRTPGQGVQPRPTPLPLTPELRDRARIAPVPLTPEQRDPARMTPLPALPRQRARVGAKPPLERPRLDRRSKLPGGVLDSFEEERRLKKRNDSLRRAFKATPGGEEAPETIEALVDAE